MWSTEDHNYRNTASLQEAKNPWHTFCQDSRFQVDLPSGNSGSWFRKNALFQDDVNILKGSTNPDYDFFLFLFLLFIFCHLYFCLFAYSWGKRFKKFINFAKKGKKLWSMLASPSCGYISDFYSLQNVSKYTQTDWRLFDAAKWFRSYHLKKINSYMLSIGYVMYVGKIK